MTQPVPESGGNLPGPQPRSGWGSGGRTPLLQVDKVRVGAQTPASWFSMTAEGTPAAELAELLVRGSVAASVGLTPGEGAQPRPRSSVERRPHPRKQKPSLETKPGPKLLASGSWAPVLQPPRPRPRQASHASSAVRTGWPPEGEGRAPVRTVPRPQSALPSWVSCGVGAARRPACLP